MYINTYTCMDIYTYYIYTYIQTVISYLYASSLN